MPAPKKSTKTSVVKAVVTPVPEASNDAAERKLARPAGTPKADKAVKAPKAAKVDTAAQADKSAKADKPRKPKLVRDSFTIPKAEYATIDALKLRAAKLGQPAKKSELLRAGIMALAQLPDEALVASLAAVPRVKTGRPGKA